MNDAGALEVEVEAEADVVAVVVAVVDDKVVGAAWATGRASEEPVVTVVPTTSPTAATTPLTPSHGNK
ncbi:hypothetical protein CIW47_15010 [Mycolicibacterium sp. P1-5]|nr:hypothetical protein CIW47_15010 [Mycolicibacterium sp. P1-5]